MPNTLAHIGIQTVVTRRIMKDADVQWILIGCIIPDLPWILRRIIGVTVDVNPYDLRLYAIVQSSFFFCLILCFLLSMLSTNHWRTFLILSCNSFFHLMLDALQTKWGNGVLLFAPFNWELINFGLFWPESTSTYILTGFGLVVFCFYCFKDANLKGALVFRPLPFIFFFLTYLILPLFLLTDLEKNNTHFIKTLRSFETRQGHYVELDRAGFMATDDTFEVTTFAGEKIGIEGIKPKKATAVSIQGTFVDNRKIKVLNYHFHNVYFRDIASYMGLSLILLYWLKYFLLSNKSTHWNL